MWYGKQAHCHTRTRWFGWLLDDWQFLSMLSFRNGTRFGNESIDFLADMICECTHKTVYHMRKAHIRIPASTPSKSNVGNRLRLCCWRCFVSNLWSASLFDGTECPPTNAEEFVSETERRRDARQTRCWAYRGLGLTRARTLNIYYV